MILTPKCTINVIINCEPLTFILNLPANITANVSFHRGSALRMTTTMFMSIEFHHNLGRKIYNVLPVFDENWCQISTCSFIFKRLCCMDRLTKSMFWSPVNWTSHYHFISHITGACNSICSATTCNNCVRMEEHYKVCQLTLLQQFIFVRSSSHLLHQQDRDKFFSSSFESAEAITWLLNESI